MNTSTQAPLVMLDQVGKSYPMRTNAAGRLAELWSMLRGRAAGGAVFHALQDVSFDVQRGQSTGLIGANGAGKSTLLKLIAGVVRPTTGQVQVQGRVGALLELGAGFHPEYTGRDNIGLAGALMGMSPAETAQHLDDIIAFADIGQHIDQPVKHYSSGMVVRLGFAVATSLRPDLLITDEVLAVGDESFQRKCIAWMEDYLAGGGTLLLCSHSMYHIQKLCTQAAWIDGGRLRKLGPAGDVTRDYLDWHEEKKGAKRPSVLEATPADGSTYQMRSMQLNGVDMAEPITLAPRAVLRVTGTIFSPDDRPPAVAVGLVRVDGTPVFGVYSDADGSPPCWPLGGKVWGFAVEFPDVSLLPGRYFAKACAMDPEGMRLFDCMERKFDVRGQSRAEGICELDYRWLANDKTA